MWTLLVIGLVLGSSQSIATAQEPPPLAPAANPQSPAQGGHHLYFPVIERRPSGAPGAPALSVAQPSRGDIRLTWQPGYGALSYTVWLSQAANLAGARAVYTGGGTSFALTLAPGTYYFRVQAVNRLGAEGSNIVSVAVAAPPTPTPTPTTPPPPPPPPGCQAIPGVSYGSLSIEGSPSDRPADQHADINLSLRGWSPVSEFLGLVDYNGNTDGGAPQLPGLFSDNRTPRFTSAHRVYNWDWATNRRGSPITAWPVTLLGMATSGGEVLRLPDSGYDIGSGYDALVLYATETRLTIKYTREDNVVRGYTLHLENVCTEPSLLALYRQLNAQGRRTLPALRPGQPLGRATGSEILVAVRDTGNFMDPRSRKDWWRGR